MHTPISGKANRNRVRSVIYAVCILFECTTTKNVKRKSVFNSPRIHKICNIIYIKILNIHMFDSPWIRGMCGAVYLWQIHFSSKIYKNYLNNMRKTKENGEWQYATVFEYEKHLSFSLCIFLFLHLCLSRLPLHPNREMFIEWNRGDGEEKRSEQTGKISDKARDIQQISIRSHSLPIFYIFFFRLPQHSKNMFKFVKSSR